MSTYQKQTLVIQTPETITRESREAERYRENETKTEDKQTDRQTE